MSRESEPTFEASLVEIEKILRCLEEGTVTLEESIAQYERGINLLKNCHSQLAAAEQHILQLTGLDAQEKPLLEPFTHTASTNGKLAPNGTPRARTRPPGA